MKNNRGFFLLATSMQGDRRSLRERFSLLSRRPRMTVGVTLLLAAVMLLAAACSFGGGKQEPASEATQPIAVGQSYATAEDAAAAFMQQAINDQNELGGSDYQIIDSKISRCELTGSFDDLTDYVIEVYALSYRLLADHPDQIMLAGGMSMDGEWLTETHSMGSPLLILQQNGNGYTYLGCTYDGTVAEEGGNLWKHIRKLLLTPQSQRPHNGEVIVTLEGQSESMPAWLYTDIGCSIYYANDYSIGFNLASDDIHFLMAACYGDEMKNDITIALYWLGDEPDLTLALGEAADSEYSGAAQLDDGTEAQLYRASGRSLLNRYGNEQVSDVYLVQGPLGYYAIVCAYPTGTEMAEGWGARLNAMARSFQLEE